MSAFRSVATGLLRPSTLTSARATPTLRTLANPNSLRLLQQRRQLSDEARKKIDDVSLELSYPATALDLASSSRFLAADLISLVPDLFALLRTGCQEERPSTFHEGNSRSTPVRFLKSCLSNSRSSRSFAREDCRFQLSRRSGIEGRYQGVLVRIF